MHLLCLLQWCTNYYFYWLPYTLHTHSTRGVTLGWFGLELGQLGFPVRLAISVTLQIITKGELLIQKPLAGNLIYHGYQQPRNARIDGSHSKLCSHTRILNWLSNPAFSFEKNMQKALAITFSSFAPTLFISYVFKDCRDIFIAFKVPALPKLIELILRRILENSQDFSLLSSIQYFHAVQNLLTDISNYSALTLISRRSYTTPVLLKGIFETLKLLLGFLFKEYQDLSSEIIKLIMKSRLQNSRFYDYFAECEIGV